MDSKNTAFANFNVTFGDKEEPLLEHFMDIIYPAFISDIKRKYKVSTKGEELNMLFYDVKIVAVEEENYVLTGKLIKDTELDVYNQLEDGILTSTDEHYRSAPYSVFYIYLKNHRMVLIQNQNGSPDLRAFRLTANHIINTFIKEKNKETGNKLPYAMLNVVGMPAKELLDEKFSNIKKVEKMVLRFYPLNGDLELADLIHDVSIDLRRAVDAKTGSIITNSPANKTAVAELMESTYGIVDVSVQARLNNSEKCKITNDSISTKTSVVMTEKEINSPKTVHAKFKNNKGLVYTSAENSELYDKVKHVIKKICQL